VNISNDGAFGGFYPNPGGVGNTCANVYAFDSSEEMVACCACLVTPNALVSLSAKNDLINNVLTPAIPTSIVIKIVGSEPGTSGTAAVPVFNLCNPITVGGPTSGLSTSLLAWGVTLEPSQTAGTYGPVNVPFINASFSRAIPDEFSALESVCQFVQTEGTGFGVCKSCALGALSGTKQ
jgi:hypothetical protein